MGSVTSTIDSLGDNLKSQPGETFLGSGVPGTATRAESQYPTQQINEGAAGSGNPLSGGLPSGVPLPGGLPSGIPFAGGLKDKLTNPESLASGISGIGGKLKNPSDLGKGLREGLGKGLGDTLKNPTDLGKGLGDTLKNPTAVGSQAVRIECIWLCGSGR